MRPSYPYNDTARLLRPTGSGDPYTYPCTYTRFTRWLMLVSAS